MAGFWKSRNSSSGNDESSQNSGEVKESRKPGSKFIYPVAFLVAFCDIFSICVLVLRGEKWGLGRRPITFSMRLMPFMLFQRFKFQTTKTESMATNFNCIISSPGIFRHRNNFPATWYCFIGGIRWGKNSPY